MGQVIPENEAANKLFSVPDGHDLYYVKLVGIGPNALARHNGSAAKVIDEVQGHYFVAPPDQIEEQLIAIVRRCFANRRQQLEGTNGTTENG